MSRGAILILLMLAAGIGAGLLAVWHRHRQMSRVMGALSPQVVDMIAHAPQVELLQLAPTDGSETQLANLVEIRDTSYRITGRKDIANSPGFTYVRARLTSDASYDWSFQPEAGNRSWQYLLRLSDGDNQARLAFDIANGWLGSTEGSPQRSATGGSAALDPDHPTDDATMMLLGHGSTLSLRPVSEGLAAFLQEQFGDE